MGTVQKDLNTEAAEFTEEGIKGIKNG